MFTDPKRKFLFKCEECSMILSIDLEEQEEIDKVDNNKMILECPCGGNCHVLRD